MKNFFLFLALLPATLMAQERIMVIADPHVMAESLLNTESPSYQEMLEGQPVKMLDLSEAVFKALVDTAIAYKPALVMIPGDLTKDSEWESHQVVIAQINRLQQAGVPTLVIPGNHDIGGNAYAYLGEEKERVENMTNEAWEEAYKSTYQQVIAKDDNSHSYVAEPLKGVTVLAIDGSNNNAGTGELSEHTLRWLLDQADEAVAKGHAIIAMSHWQLLEHFDRQGRIEPACHFKDREALRDSLMHHGVHLILTGHFHVNGITTFRDTTGQTTDSIVEVSTGSPITYPCPYRWLTLSKDRSQLDVETEILTAVPGCPQLTETSLTYMREHAGAMLPKLSLRVWNRVDEVLDEAKELLGEMVVEKILECVPEDDSTKMAVTEKYFGSTIIDLYQVHSEANEWQNPKSDSLAQALYNGMDGMIHELTDEKMNNFIYRTFQVLMISLAQEKAQVPVQSLVEDITNWDSNVYQDRTDDLRLRMTINTPHLWEAIDQTKAVQDGVIYDLLGRPVAQPTQSGVYILNGQKFVQ